MALVVGSVVSPLVTDPQYTTGVQAQPPQFGVVSDLSVPATPNVLWPSGQIETAIPVAVLDEIVSADPSSVAAFAGRYVRHTRTGSSNSDAAGFDGYVVQLYKRQRSGTATPTPDLALIRTQSGFWIEALVSELEAVPGN